ncbi:MAG: CZB domain-containing protein [Sulfuricurvum sp.]|nr:CZB domain-containing protein [Sulfuricurvum sp.]MDD5386462.1 CZB domain-containing protein [Sulfuricurvum sp.]
MFKSNTYIGIVNGQKGSWKPGDQHTCRLGKWYDSGMGKERFSHLPSFKAIAAPHAIVHTCARDNFKFIEEGDHTVENKKAIIENFTSIEKASQQLFIFMDELIQESERETVR